MTPDPLTAIVDQLAAHGEQLTRLDAQRHFSKRFDRWIAGIAPHDVAQLDDGLAHDRGTSTDIPS